MKENFQLARDNSLQIIAHVEELLTSTGRSFRNGDRIDLSSPLNTYPLLEAAVESIVITDIPNKTNGRDIGASPEVEGSESSHCKENENGFEERVVKFWEADFTLYLFKLSTEGPCEESLTECFGESGGAGGDSLSNTTAFAQYTLPCREFSGFWDSLHYDVHIKPELLSYIETSLLFSQRDINKNHISWNNVVLLHGPPGTGKTTLCKALAQKLAIRLTGSVAADKTVWYKEVTLLEIHSHSLFSKWFSESGKLVTKLFEYIHELCEDKDLLVCVLIDEVESLVTSRVSGKGSSGGNDPGDAVRVVNAVLTQVDYLKTKSNVLILTTSNITRTIDAAFLDRADIKQYIDYPSARVRKALFLSSISELMRKGLLCDTLPLLKEQDSENRQDLANRKRREEKEEGLGEKAVHGNTMNLDIIATKLERNLSIKDSCFGNIAELRKSAMPRGACTLDLSDLLTKLPSKSVECLDDITRRSDRLSGRTIKKLCFHAYARMVNHMRATAGDTGHLQKATHSRDAQQKKPFLTTFLPHLRSAVVSETESRVALSH